MILVTGASGFIGSYLIPKIAPLSKVRCLASSPESASTIMRHPSVETMVVDLSKTKDFTEVLDGIDCVIHMAALLRKNNAQQMRQVNVEATQGLVHASKNRRIGRFVFISTENVLREDIQDPYALTKREAEKIVGQLDCSIILRPCFVYGEGDTHGLGRLISVAKKNPVVPLFGGLKSTVQPIYVDDVVEYIVRAAQNHLNGAYILAGPDRITLNDFVLKVLKSAGIKKRALLLPKLLYYAAAIIGDQMAPSLGWGKNQFNNIYRGRNYSTDTTIKAFGYAPKSLEQGIKLWLEKPVSS